MPLALGLPFAHHDAYHDAYHDTDARSQAHGFLAVPAAAQWLNLPTPGIPRTPDNKPDLSGPVPRTSGGKPDFSGMWVPRDVVACDAKERGMQCTELPLTPQLLNFAAGLKDGLPYQPWAADLIKSRAKDVAHLAPTCTACPQLPARVGLSGVRKDFPDAHPTRHPARVQRQHKDIKHFVR